MTEEELIRQLKSLQEMKPNQHWVVKTERSILGERRTFSFSWSPVLIGMVAILLVFAGLTGYHYYPKNQVVVKPHPVSQIASLAPSLENLKNQIQKISEGLKQMPASVAMSSQKKEIIEKTITQSQQILRKVQALDKDQSLSSLIGKYKTASKKLETEYYRAFNRTEFQKFDQEKIQGLLSEKKAKQLVQIKALTKEGKDEEAFYQLLILENGDQSH